jgi:FAD/FMN-containing dehydrogenase
MVTQSSWGRLSSPPHQLIMLRDPSLAASQIQTNRPGLPYGMGRSYGDVCLNPEGHLWNTTGLDHFIRFSPDTGIVQCEAGVLLRDIQRLMVPRGWMLPVTPGTQLVTVGGAIANDVHGKNHHVYGSFGDNVLEINLVRTTGEQIVCGPYTQRDWFTATIGGLGLTGLIVDATIQLRRVEGPWLATETLPYDSLDEFFSLADTSEKDWEYTVSWIDCIGGSGRGIFMRGNHIPVKSHVSVKPGRKLSFPFTPPVSLINRLSLRPFNALYYHQQARKAGIRLANYESFFYPLDNILEWNRLYGPKGFYQYQCVVPRRDGQASIQAMLDEISDLHEGSFLAVLKTFGERQAPGLLSFPQPGVTLALDFPNKGTKTLSLFDRLDHIVSSANGRLYPAKDARMSHELFQAGYPALSEFLAYRDPGISSAMSRRLMGS